MKMYRNSLNLYDTASTVWYENASRTDSGAISESTISHFTESYTAVEPKTTYYLAGNLGSSGNAHRVYFLTENKEWIARSASMTFNVHTFTTPANCKFIQVQVVKQVTSTADWMLTVGDTEQPFEPYNVVDWYGYTYKLRASGAWTDGAEKKRSGGAWT